jgi:hypothetical protein
MPESDHGFSCAIAVDVVIDVAATLCDEPKVAATTLVSRFASCSCGEVRTPDATVTVHSSIVVNVPLATLKRSMDVAVLEFAEFTEKVAAPHP